MNHFACVIPILNVSNCAASIDYYVDVLGFSRKWDWGSPPVFACMTRDHVDIFLCQGAQGAIGNWMSIFVADVDVLHSEYQAKKAIIGLPPTNLPWGTREMNVADLDGHRIRFGSDATGPADDEGMQAFAQRRWNSLSTQRQHASPIASTGEGKSPGSLLDFIHAFHHAPRSPSPR